MQNTTQQEDTQFLGQRDGALFWLSHPLMLFQARTSVAVPGARSRWHGRLLRMTPVGRQQRHTPACAVHHSVTGHQLLPGCEELLQEWHPVRTQSDV